jgi:DNA repair exonuclease SbcCD ATPase subunit
MRLAADGTVLAANDAALALLGVTSGAQALGRSFSSWIPPDQRERWRAFATGVVQGSPASIECEIMAQSGGRHPTLFHGVPIADHPDGVVSMAVSARVVAGQHQLETAMVELEEQLLERDAERIKARARLAEAEESRRQLAEKVDALEARLHAREAGLDEERQLRQLRADLEARNEALAAADAARRTAEANCARALADVRQLEVALEAFAARQQQMADEREADRQRARQMAESAAVRHEQELTDARNGPEWERLAARLKEREAAVRELETARAVAQAELEEAQGSRVRLEASLKEAQRTLAKLEQREQDAVAQREALQARLDEALAACQEREAALHRMETAHADLAAAHAAATAEHDRLVSALHEHAGRLEALANGVPRSGGAPAAADRGADLHAGRGEGRA